MEKETCGKIKFIRFSAFLRSDFLRAILIWLVTINSAFDVCQMPATDFLTNAYFLNGSRDTSTYVP